MSGSVPRGNILLVDDEPANLLALEAGLADLGQNLVTASSGTEALRRLLHDDFAVILLDVQMPGFDGLETAAAIRERERSRHVPIIFLTGHDHTDESMFKGYSAGAVDYLVKPVRMEVLRAKLGVFLELMAVRTSLQAEIAERTRAAREVIALNEELSRKNRALQETVVELQGYSYSISHNMRAPLRAMKGYAEVLLDEALPRLSEEHRGYLRRIHSGAGLLDRLIQDVLSYSDLARARFALENVDLDDLAREVLEQHPELREAGLSVRIPERLRPVRANAALLAQCLTNMLSNAAKFVAPGRAPRATLTTREADGRVVVCLEDEGIGVAEGDRERIYGIFTTVHPAGTYTGTGIGLSLVRKAAERMGGAVGVEPAPGGGSRFWLRLGAAVPDEDHPDR